MDWFLYDNGLRLEIIKVLKLQRSGNNDPLKKLNDFFIRVIETNSGY